MSAPFASAILVAAGRSSRMGQHVAPKPLLPLLGRPVLEYSIKAFQAAESIAEIIVVARPEQFGVIQSLLEAAGPKARPVVEGGAERFDSVRAGCLASESTSEVLMVHDAARPLVLASDIDRVAQTAREEGAAVLAHPVTDSLHRSMDQRKVFEPVDRSSLWAAQTPQAFGRRAFLGILEEAERLGSTPTDDVTIFERFVGAVALVPGTTENLKITHPTDLLVAEALLNARQV